MTHPDTLPVIQGPLGIIAGNGMLPVRLAEACRERGMPYTVLAIDREADARAMALHPHEWLTLGKVGRAISRLKSLGIRDIIFAGGVRRPALSASLLHPDLTGARLLARLTAARLRGDDALLSTVIRFFDEQGFRVLGAEVILAFLLASKGVMGVHPPDAQAETDIALGLQVLHALGSFDIGQAVVVRHGRVLAIEGPEGTDALLERAGELRLTDTLGGVLVKARKQGQEQRVDLPTIGPRTAIEAAEARLAGIAVEAGGVQMIDRDAVIREADEAGLFITGITASTDA